MRRTVMLFFVFWFALAGQAFADDKERDVSSRLSAVEKQLEEVKNKVESGTGIQISGFVDTSFFYDDNARSSTFSLDEVEADFVKEISTGISVRADLNFRNVDDDDGSLSTDDVLEQGYVTFRLPLARSIELTFGKFNAPIGFELLDPVDMYQFSHALVFNLGIPTNVTGAMLAAQLASPVDLSIYLVNGWDNISDNNKDKTMGGRIGFTPIENFNFGISAIYGAEGDNEDGDQRFVLDLDATLNLSDSTLFGLEVNYGTEENLPTSLPVPGRDVDWFGLLLMAHHDFTSWLGATLRYDFFDDNDGGRTGVVQQLQAAAAALTFTLGKGAGVIFEYRHDWSDVNSFILANGTPDDNNDTFALEFTYSF